MNDWQMPTICILMRSLSCLTSIAPQHSQEAHWGMVLLTQRNASAWFEKVIQNAAIGSNLYDNMRKTFETI